MAVVISEDPSMTHRPVEALRIALGLTAGEHETTVVLLGKAPALLSEDIDTVVDAEILEKYLPSIKQLNMPFLVEAGTMQEPRDVGFAVTERKSEELREFLLSVDRTLVF